METDPSVVDAWTRHCLPHYNTTKQDRQARLRTIARPATEVHFFRRDGERWRMDSREALSKIRCPTLVLSGDSDPVTPEADAREIAAHLPAECVRLEIVANAGHGTHRDQPLITERLIRGFIAH